MLTESKRINNTASPIMLRIKQNFCNNKRLFLIISLLQLLGLPLVSVILQISFYHETAKHYTDNLPVYALMSVLAFAFASASGILFSFKCFRYLYKKTETDMNLCLPMTASQRFTGDFFSGLIMYIIPYIGASLLSVISLIIGRSLYPVFWESIAEHISILSFFIDGLLIMIMLYTLTSFITVCCGNSFECLIYTLIVNIAVPLFLFVLSYIIFNDAFGINYSQEALPSIMATSPAGGILKILYYANYMSDYFNIDYDVPFKADNLSWNIIWGLSFIAIIIILFAVTFYLYRKRKAEDVSKPFVFSFIYYIFILMMTIAIIGSMSRLHASIAGVLVSAFIFVVMSVIKNRGLHKMLRPCIFYIVSVAVSFSVVKLSDATDGFGQIYKVPDVADIRSACIISENNFYKIYSNIENFIFTDKNDIELITQMQTDIIQDNKAHNYGKEYKYKSLSSDFQEFHNEYDNGDAYSASGSRIKITYMLDNKKIVYRNYIVPYSIWSEYMIRFAENHNYREQISENFSKEVVYGLGGLYCGNTSSYNHNIGISDPRYEISEDMDVPDENVLKELAAAYKNDIMSLTDEDIMNFKSFCMINNHYIGTCFTNTIDVLKKNGLTVSRLSDYSKRLDYLDSSALFIADSDYIIQNNYTQSDLITNDCGTPCQYAVTEYDYNSLLKLFNVAQPHYFTSEHCYVMQLGGKNYIIPNEYSDLAEEFMSESKLEKVQIQKDDQ